MTEPIDTVTRLFPKIVKMERMKNNELFVLVWFETKPTTQELKNFKKLHGVE